MTCSALLRGHERITRLVFAGFYLGLWAFWVIQNLDELITMEPLGIPNVSYHYWDKAAWLRFGQLEPVWILAFILYGSTWVERRRSRQTGDGISPRIAEG